MEHWVEDWVRKGNRTAMVGATLAFLHAGVMAMNAQEIWNQYQANPDNHRNIPNCSFAGYKQGAALIPDVKQVVSVADFGAKAGDANFDNAKAFQTAIQAAAVKGGGAVHIPSGVFHFKGIVRLNESRVVLRGAGVGKTMLWFPTKITSRITIKNNGFDQLFSWDGGNVWMGPKDTFEPNPASPDKLILNWTPVGALNKQVQVYEYWRPGPMLAGVSADAERGDWSVQVNDASKLKPGQLVSMMWKLDGSHSFYKHVCEHEAAISKTNWAEATWIKPTAHNWFQWPVQIDKIEGNKVKLKQPLRQDIKGLWAVELRELENRIEESGIENLTVIGNPSKYDTHWGISDGNGIYLNRTWNCWVRNVEVLNATSGIILASAKNSTIDNVVIGSDPKYSAYSYNHMHHPIAVRVESADNLFQNFTINSKGKIWHGLSVEWLGSGNVFSKGKMDVGTFDSHRAASYDFIRTEIEIKNEVGQPGGSANAGPYVGRRVVHWNVRITGNRASYVNIPNALPYGALVGVQGPAADLKFGIGANVGCITVDPNKVPSIANLYTKQLDLRLGQSPTTWAGRMADAGGDAAIRFAPTRSGLLREEWNSLAAFNVRLFALDGRLITASHGTGSKAEIQVPTLRP